ncbi:hypothetical protein Tco_1119098, partial [Tanacetum coccineum]
MPYLRFTKAIIHHFISKDKTISMRNHLFMHGVKNDSVLGFMKFVSMYEIKQVYGKLIPDVLVSKEMLESEAYKTYNDFATRKTGVTIRDTPTETKKKTPEKSLKLKGMEIISDAAMLAANIKKALKATKRDLRSQYQTGGSSEGAGSKPEVPGESKGKTKDINEGVGSKSKVLDV